MPSDKHLTKEEKGRVKSATARRDRAQKQGRHVDVIKAEREINAVFDGASDRERD